MHRKIIICVLCSVFCASVLFAWGEVPKEYPKAKDFTLEDLQGNKHALSDYKGRVVFLNFWATWCPPCRSEMPSMQKLYETWNKDQYVMLAVDIREGKETVKSFAEKNGYTFPILLDQSGKVAGAYRVQGIPATFIIDEKGQIIAEMVGAREWDLDQVKKLLK